MFAVHRDPETRTVRARRDLAEFHALRVGPLREKVFHGDPLVLDCGRHVRLRLEPMATALALDVVRRMRRRRLKLHRSFPFVYRGSLFRLVLEQCDCRSSQ